MAEEKCQSIRQKALIGSAAWHTGDGALNCLNLRPTDRRLHWGVEEGSQLQRHISWPQMCVAQRTENPPQGSGGRAGCCGNGTPVQYSEQHACMQVSFVSLFPHDLHLLASSSCAFPAHFMSVWKKKKICMPPDELSVISLPHISMLYYVTLTMPLDSQVASDTAGRLCDEISRWGVKSWI